jgi:hypothetical protein
MSGLKKIQNLLRIRCLACKGKFEQCCTLFLLFQFLLFWYTLSGTNQRSVFNLPPSLDLSQTIIYVSKICSFQEIKKFPCLRFAIWCCTHRTVMRFSLQNTETARVQREECLFKISNTGSPLLGFTCRIKLWDH